MARTNYSFEKRQREIAKRKKKEEKRLKKVDAKNKPSLDTDTPQDTDIPQDIDNHTHIGDKL